MNIGMLWFDNDPRTALTAKVNRAADYYRQKYGLVPDLCLVHPSMLGDRPDLVEGEPGRLQSARTAPSCRAICGSALRIKLNPILHMGETFLNKKVLREECGDFCLNHQSPRPLRWHFPGCDSG